MLYLIVSLAGLNPVLFDASRGIIVLIFAFLLALFLAPSLNIASWLPTRSGVMYENKIDGTRINLGIDLRQFLERVIGPISALSLIRALWSGFPDVGLIVGFLGMEVILSIPSVFVTILLLGREALAKLSVELNDKLNKHIS
jgi:hypothetical protein